MNAENSNNNNLSPGPSAPSQQQQQQPKKNSPPNPLGSRRPSTVAELSRERSGTMLPQQQSEQQQQQQQQPQHIKVLFLGKRDLVVPVMIAVSGGGPCRSVPESWKDTSVIEVELPKSLPSLTDQVTQQHKMKQEGDSGSGQQQQKDLHDDDSNFVPATFYFSESASLVHDLQPTVAVLCYDVMEGARSAKSLLDEFSFEVRAATPRPAICLCGANIDKIHTVTDINMSEPVSASEACDLFVRTRAATYAEVSSYLGVHLSQVAESISHAALLHAEKRPTPELIRAMRDHVVAAAFAGAKWVARRDRKSKMIFYYNRQTKRPQWDRPADYDGIEPQFTEEEKRQLAAAEVEAKERRARLEREQQMNDAYIADVHLYEEKMRALEKRYEEATEVNARYEKEVVELRRQMNENSELLRKLQHQHDTRIKNRSTFVNSAAEKDSLVEKELQAAREREKEIENTLALREEKEEDVHLMELATENKKLAADVRSCLQKQLETQKTLASNSARCSELSRESEQLTVRLMKLKAKQQDSRKMLAQGNDEIATLRSKVAHLEDEIDAVVNEDLYEVTAISQRQKQLYRAIAHAEKALKDARGSIRSKEVVDEHERLQLEQRRLVSDVGQCAALSSLWELKVRRALSNFQVIGHDLGDVLNDVHACATDLAGYVQAAAQSMQLKLPGGHGGANDSSSSPMFIKNSSRMSRTAADASSTSSAPLEDKLILLHRAALHLVRESHKDTLRRSQKTNEVSMEVANVFDDVLSVPDYSSSNNNTSSVVSIPETLSAADRLLMKCEVALKSTAPYSSNNNNNKTQNQNQQQQHNQKKESFLKEALIASFENHLRKTVSNQQQEVQRKKNVRPTSFKKYF